jgi:hypothetical protein
MIQSITSLIEGEGNLKINEINLEEKLQLTFIFSLLAV